MRAQIVTQILYIISTNFLFDFKNFLLSRETDGADKNGSINLYIMSG
jgi:hypothetical protein